jgi:NAD(P)-dependent dehydrogenase (short-subunit alcohol dehydrogenase family)
MGKLEGKIALITGGNSGIGLATAKQFVNEGAYVFITGRRNSELAAAVKEIGGNVTGVQGDVSNLGDLDRLFAQIKREKGKLDIVFANAGVAEVSPLGKITEEHYDSIFNINVKGVVFTVQKALPLMPDGASIILNASIVASKGLSANSVYSATKAAVRSFARTWTTDLKERRIRVNAVSPGFIDTPGLSNLLASTGTGQQGKEMISNAVPLGRFGAPDEIAKAWCFSPPTTAATSRERNCLWMVASHKCKLRSPHACWPPPSGQLECHSLHRVSRATRAAARRNVVEKSWLRLFSSRSMARRLVLAPRGAAAHRTRA